MPGKDIEREAIAREWPLDEDGFPHRQAARVVLLNPSGEAYLILGHDIDEPAFRWWFTPGGGIEPGESAREAAVRELREETGWAADPERLEGPVLSRQATFRFVGSIRKQDELFFLLRVNRAEAAAVTAGIGRELTALEENVLDRAAWHSPQQLTAAQARGENVFPSCLPELIARWARGWDGELVRLKNDENKPFSGS